ncbi:hypothetical protein LTR09_001717 [Extremus antarcticus]|uniref:BTB domain-containing protein n=1 Tax=Extremus antarcticus TaxID=702011 RepID=A0AAJ0GH89_9PEZI|nr:hypothetical protein LTR09_001717 [Extremus antarcticus]
MSTEDEVASRTMCPSDERPDPEELPSTTYIKLFVGPNRQLFEFREDLICTRCPFFFSAFCGDFVEAKTKTLDMTDDDPERFEELQTWFDSESIPNGDQSWLALSRTWLFADKYHIDELQNAIVDVLYQKYTAHESGINIAFETLDYVAEHTFPRSPLRLLFADMLANGTSLQQVPKRAENVPQEFLQEIWLSLRRQIDRNGPANISLLSNPVQNYYVSSAAYKATAMPKSTNQSDIPTQLHCQSDRCMELETPTEIRDTIHADRRHRNKKMMTLTSPPYRDAATGAMTIIDAQVNDSGFWCDGPRCDPRLQDLGLPDWALMSGDRYHCLDCSNTDFCSVCVRGELECKTEKHSMLRIRSTFSRKTATSDAISIPERQRRLEDKLCMRCASPEHLAPDCQAKDAVLDADVEAEE